MTWAIAGTTLALVAFSAGLGGWAVGLLALASIAWLLVALRPVEAGAMVASWSRSRFE